MEITPGESVNPAMRKAYSRHYLLCPFPSNNARTHTHLEDVLMTPQPQAQGDFQALVFPCGALSERTQTLWSLGHLKDSGQVPVSLRGA